MSFDPNYVLVEPVPELDPARSYQLSGRDVRSGSPIVMHLLPAESRLSILMGIQSLPGQERQMVLKTGEWNGMIYVVTTVLPGGPLLRNWLASNLTPQAFSQAGAWKIPASFGANGTPEPSFVPPGRSDPDPIAAPRMTEPTGSAPVSAAPGEFTRLFQQPAISHEPPPSSGGVSTLPAAAASEPGEFTRLLQAPMTGNNQVSDRSLQFGTAAPVPGQPGEFTRLIQMPSVEDKKASVPASPAPPLATAGTAPSTETGVRGLAAGPVIAGRNPTSGGQESSLRESSAGTVEYGQSVPPAALPQPGEFTRMFQLPAQRPADQLPAPVPPQAPPSSPQSPGEFTRMFQPQSGASFGDRSPAPAPAQPIPQSQPGEFTRMMEPPIAPPAYRPGAFAPTPPNPPVIPPPRPQAGEFTQMFGLRVGTSSSVPQPPSPRAGAVGLGATRAFSVPQQPAIYNQPQGPSEFTQMFSVPAPQQSAPIPQAQPQKESPAPAARVSNRWLLVALGVILLLAIMIVVFVAVKR